MKKFFQIAKFLIVLYLMYIFLLALSPEPDLNTNKINEGIDNIGEVVNIGVREFKEIFYNH